MDCAVELTHWITSCELLHLPLQTTIGAFSFYNVNIHVFCSSGITLNHLYLIFIPFVKKSKYKIFTTLIKKSWTWIFCFDATCGGAQSLFLTLLRPLLMVLGIHMWNWGLNRVSCMQGKNLNLCTIPQDHLKLFLKNVYF